MQQYHCHQAPQHAAAHHPSHGMPHHPHQLQHQHAPPHHHAAAAQYAEMCHNAECSSPGQSQRSPNQQMSSSSTTSYGPNPCLSNGANYGVQNGKQLYEARKRGKKKRKRKRKRSSSHSFFLSLFYSSQVDAQCIAPSAAVCQQDQQEEPVPDHTRDGRQQQRQRRPQVQQRKLHPSVLRAQPSIICTPPHPH